MAEALTVVGASVPVADDPDDTDAWAAPLEACIRALDRAAGAVHTVATTGGTTTLSDAQSDTKQLLISGALTSNATVYLKARPGFWFVKNATSGAYSVTIRVVGNVGAAVTIAQGGETIVKSDGTDCTKVDGATLGGAGTMAGQNADAVAITGGEITGITNLVATGGQITGITDLAVADGGTGASNAGGARTNLGLVIGTDVQAYSAKLAAVAGLTWAANKILHLTGTATLETKDITAAGLALLDDATASDQLTTLGFSTFGKSLIDDTDAAAARTTLLAVGNLHKVTKVNSSSTFNFDSTTKYFKVIVIGGGGGGGGTQSSASGAGSVGGGGGSGAIAEGFYEKTASSASITIGAGGSGNNGASGDDGGTTTFDDGTVTVSATGGRGGTTGVSSGDGTSGAASSTRAAASGGNIRNAPGQLGQDGIVMPVTGAVTVALSGAGADCPGFGSAGPATGARSGSVSAANGAAASGNGAGGGGGCVINSSAVRAGGAGSNGTVIIEEYR